MPKNPRGNNVETIDLWYPNDSQFDTIEVNLVDVRSADSIRIKYDFERDGWIVEQASIFEWEADDDEMNADWQEVAFVQAWGRLPPDLT